MKRKNFLMALFGLPLALKAADKLLEDECVIDADVNVGETWPGTMDTWEILDHTCVANEYIEKGNIVMDTGLRGNLNLNLIFVSPMDSLNDVIFGVALNSARKGDLVSIRRNGAVNVLVS